MGADARAKAVVTEMYNSEITAEAFATAVADSLSIGRAAPPEFYLDELSRLEQLLYSEYIREERMLSAFPIDGEIDLGEAVVPEGERAPRADDVFAVCIGNRALKRRRLSEAYLLDVDDGEECYYKSDDQKIAICSAEDRDGEEVTLFYRAAPRLKRGEGATDAVALPFEFLPLAEAKLRGEAYKRAEDDARSAKWLSEYNSLLSGFAEWLTRSAEGRR